MFALALVNSVTVYTASVSARTIPSWATSAYLQKVLHVKFEFLPRKFSLNLRQVHEISILCHDIIIDLEISKIICQ